MTKPIILLCLGLLSLLAVTSCGDDDSVTEFSAPELSLAGDAEVMLKPESAITVEFNISAEGGISTIVVNRNGGFLEEIEVEDPDLSTYTYTGQTVPDAAIEGDEINYEFIAVNTQDTESTPVTFTVSVAVYDLVENSTVGDVYLVPTPENGLVPNGETIKFAGGRSYLIDSTMIFQESSLVIEEGVTVYMNAAVDELSHDIIIGEGTNVTIEGTSTSPIVITSSKLMTGESPSAGDWDRFEMTGTTNSSIRYLRLEYAGDRAFRTIELDNTNSLSYVNVFKCTDEGFYITDGNIEAKYLVATETGDSNFRINNQEGNIQYLIAFNEGAGEEALYIDGTSELLISNVTVVGPGKETKDSPTEYENTGIRITSSTGSKVYNAVVTGMPDWATRAQNVVPTDIDGISVLAFSHVYDNDTRDRSDADVWFTEASFMNSEDPIAGIAPGSIVPSTTASSSFDPTTLGSFFTTGSFVGAIENAANDWTVGWVKNPDGTIR